MAGRRLQSRAHNFILRRGKQGEEPTEREACMVRMKKMVLSGIVVAGLLSPSLGVAHPPPGRTPGGEFVRGVVAPTLSVVYFPVKFGVSVVGAALGGVSGFLTGGNDRAAEGIWHPTVGGTYFITPAILEGECRFLPFDYGDPCPYPAPSTSVAPGSMPSH